MHTEHWGAGERQPRPTSWRDRFLLTARLARGGPRPAASATESSFLVTLATLGSWHAWFWLPPRQT